MAALYGVGPNPGGQSPAAQGSARGHELACSPAESHNLTGLAIMNILNIIIVLQPRLVKDILGLATELRTSRIHCSGHLGLDQGAS